MKDTGKKDIVDSRGNALVSKKGNGIILFLKNNARDVISICVAVGSILVAIVNLIASKTFSVSCSNFYGIDGKYFNGIDMFEDKLIFIFDVVVLFFYPFMFSYVNKKVNSKLYAVLTFLLTVCILLVQNILYTLNLIENISVAWLRRLIENNITYIVLFIADIIIAYFIIIRNYFWKNKKCNMAGKIILAIALIIYILNVAIGITIKIDDEISDKKTYEVIEQNRVIVSDYDGKFVVMNCEIRGETIILKKGTYSLEDMTGVPITYHKYEKVICE